MLVGIDVGGTFTDAVVVQNNRVVAQSKVPTTHNRLLDGILAVMDQVMAALEIHVVERITLSTTIVTNTLIEGRTDPVGLCIIPGPGLDISPFVPGKAVVLSGYTDHRGRERAVIRQEEILAACRQVHDCEVLAVSGKFAVRNPKQEMSVAQELTERKRPRHISLGTSLSGSLNFLRRTNSAYYNAAVWRVFQDFAGAVETAVRQRGMHAPVYILKADGGTLPLAVARDLPVESIFTGPAASVLGIIALNQPQIPAVSLDIGGTTTDIALWEGGIPLFAARGAYIGSYPTAVRSFRLKSVGVGGDSFVRRQDRKLCVGPQRRGAPMAMGGPVPTVTDALIVAGKMALGDCRLAQAAMHQVALAGQSAKAAAAEVLAAAAAVIGQALSNMIEEQAAEPVYRVEDIITGKPFVPELLIGVGGAAAGLTPVVAEHLQMAYLVPPGAEVANAVGAAVSRPTLEVTFRADTEQGYYTVTEMGLREPLPSGKTGRNALRSLAQQHLIERARQAGIDAGQIEQVYEENFNVVKGFRTVGEIMTSRLQIMPGVLGKIDSFC
ncbi:hypothetical protein P22_3768 [Propionispora sp. 2/2-37]|uniref:hydantoinase/oxoprolinase family protein n=1 Tax=Propionispora sp. 2/2-37 TaxID=1677858 RepID=UPI0006BB6249|nr:hydantoinase/oxoprolinase family protein [Propionispora sp. 2/2-37]CUH97636.1 hypothetical protein P22_3768 [Propionispora sp. 2/2-37]